MRVPLPGFLFSAALTLASSALTGCSLSSVAVPAAEAPGATPLSQIMGTVHGGQQAVVGAHVYVLQAGTGGYGAASTSLITTGAAGTDSVGSFVLSGAYGSFSVTTTYTCNAGSQVYLLALGGDPGAGNNSMIGLMAALGQCPAAGTFATATPYVTINEVSTAAAAWALAGFAVDATHIASSGTQQARLGLANAFATVTNLESLATGTAYNATPAAGSSGVVPQAEINTLANILAACVNTTGPTATPCATLRRNATSDGTLTGPQPGDTATAAFNITHHPVSNVGALFALQSPAAPFQPSLSSTPADFTLNLIFSGGGLTPADVYPSQSHTVAVDGNGHIWAVGGNGAGVKGQASLSEFSPLGVATNHPASTVDDAAGIAIDPGSNTIWVSNYGDSISSVASYAIASGSTAQYLLDSSANNIDVAVDSSGRPWILDEAGEYGYGKITRLNLDGTVAATAGNQPGVVNGMNDPVSIAIQSLTGNLWVADGEPVTSSTVSVYQPSGAAKATSSGAGKLPLSVALDASGNAWVGNTGNSVTEFSTGGAIVRFSPVQTAPPSRGFSSVAIDGLGNVWLADQSDHSMVEMSSTGVALSGSTGFVFMGKGNTGAVQSIAVDPSGNVWCNFSDNSTLRELVGGAAPVVTPLALGSANNMLGTRP